LHEPTARLIGNGLREHHGDLASDRSVIGDAPAQSSEPTRRLRGDGALARVRGCHGPGSAASRQRPVMLILDDLQWAGTRELLLLKHIVRSATPIRLLVIGTCRTPQGIACRCSRCGGCRANCCRRRCSPPPSAAPESMRSRRIFANEWRAPAGIAANRARQRESPLSS
jgi:hypothetical protein